MDYDAILAAFKEKTLKFATTVLYPVAILYTYYIIVGQICIKEFEFRTNKILFIFIFYNLLVQYTSVFYLRILPIENSTTKDIFYPEPRQSDKQYKNLNPYLSERISFRGKHRNKVCGTCKVFKPPRAHHCNSCNCCFLKMDHHCFIINTCIAFHNYKYFISWLFANSILSIYVLIVLGIAIFHLEDTPIASIIICLVTTLLNFIFSFPLFLYHCMLILRNETTIESFFINDFLSGNNVLQRDVFQEGPLGSFDKTLFSNAEIEERDRRILNPYYIGKFENFKEVFGNTFLEWISFSFTSKGNGIAFKKNTKDVEEEFE
ncbi:hypothetical protein GVAV_001470 [Gurleya vavrai]